MHKCRKKRDNLNRLAEAHVIADYGAASKSIALEKELDTFALVWT